MLHHEGHENTKRRAFHCAALLIAFKKRNKKSPSSRVVCWNELLFVPSCSSWLIRGQEVHLIQSSRFCFDGWFRQGLAGHFYFEADVAGAGGFGFDAPFDGFFGL